MTVATPTAFGEGLPFARSNLGRVRMVPAFIVTGFPAMMGHNENADAGLANRRSNLAQILEQPDFPGDAFHPRPELTPFGQKVIIGIDEEQGRPFLRIAGIRHVALP
jgi:hypothetical protein